MNKAKTRQCGSKKRHASRKAAEYARIKTQEVTGEMTLVAYQCPHCKGWHLGHAPRRMHRDLKTKRTWAAIDRAMNKTNSKDAR